MKAILIEEHSDYGVDWVVSLNGPNPPADEAIQCANNDEAQKLVRLLNNIKEN